MANIRTHIVVHHSAVSHDKNPVQFEAINRFHQRQGWGKIGYHYLIEKDGTLVRGREEDEIGAHTKQKMMNYRSIGICLTGNFDIEEPTYEQCVTLLEIIETLQKQYGIEDKNIYPHRHYASYKSCWGKLLPNDILGYLETRLSSPRVSQWANKDIDNENGKGEL